MSEARPFLVAVDPRDRLDNLILAALTPAAGYQWDGQPMPRTPQRPVTRGLRSALERLERRGVVQIERSPNGGAWSITVKPGALARGCEIARFSAWLVKQAGRT